MLILDEPTSALDIETSLKVIQNIIKIKDEKIIIIVSHDNQPIVGGLYFRGSMYHYTNRMPVSNMQFQFTNKGRTLQLLSK